MNGRILFSYFSPYFISRRFLSPPTARFGDALKDIIKPEKIPSEYWKKIIWVAMDLKKTVIEKNKMCLNYFESKHVTLLFGKPHGRFQLAFTIACDLLGLRKTLYHDPFFENQPNPADVGKVLSKLTDMFVIYGLHHDVLIKLVANTTIPIFSAGCNVYCLQKALSDMMTLQEKYHHLKGLTLAWVGPPSSIFNSYLILCPKLGMKIQYTCICVYGSGKMSPVHRVPNGKVCGLNKEYLQEFKTAKETVTGAHIIATSMHPEEKNKINLDILKNAQENWYFMHSLPRTLREVSDDVFNHENNLSWDTSENYIYVAMLKIFRKFAMQTNVPWRENFIINTFATMLEFAGLTEGGLVMFDGLAWLAPSNTPITPRYKIKLKTK